MAFARGRVVRLMLAAAAAGSLVLAAPATASATEEQAWNCPVGKVCMWATTDTSREPDMTYEPADGAMVRLNDAVYMQLVALFNNGPFTACYHQGRESFVYAEPGQQWDDLRGSDQYFTTDIEHC